MNTAHAHTLLTTSPGGCAPGPHSGHICTTQNRFRRAGIGVNPTLTVAPAGAVRAHIPAGRVCPFWAGCKHTAGNKRYLDDHQSVSLRTAWCARWLQQHCRSRSALRKHECRPLLLLLLLWVCCQQQVPRHTHCPRTRHWHLQYPAKQQAKRRLPGKAGPCMNCPPLYSVTFTSQPHLLSQTLLPPTYWPPMFATSHTACDPQLLPLSYCSSPLTAARQQASLLTTCFCCPVHQQVVLAFHASQATPRTSLLAEALRHKQEHWCVLQLRTLYKAPGTLAR
jgi:hypothetical protein